MSQEALRHREIRILLKELAAVRADITQQRDFFRSNLMALVDRFNAILAKVQALQQTQPVETDVLSQAAESSLQQV